MSILIAVGVAFVLAIALFKACWRVAEPNEALIISGIREHSISGGGAGPPPGPSGPALR